MRRCIVLALVAGFMVAADAPKDKEEAIKKTMDQLQGTWVLVSAERDGKKVPEEEVKGVTLTVTGNKFSFSKGATVGTSAEGTFTVDPTKKPIATDSTQAVGPDKGKVFLGIMELSGDTQKVCFAPPGKDRPTEFVSKPGSGVELQVWKKEKK